MILNSTDSFFFLQYCNDKGLLSWHAVEKGSRSLGITLEASAFTGPVISYVSLHLSVPPLMLPTPLFPSPLRSEQ